MVRNAAIWLDRPGRRGLLAFILSLSGRFIHDGVRSVRYDGGWVHRFKHHTTVEPEPRLRGYHIAGDFNRELWCHLYEPRSGDVVFDVGAGIGSETVYFADAVGPSGRVISLEAHPVIFDYLARTVAMNELHQVRPLNVAVSDVSGQLFIENDLTNFLSNSVSDGAGEIAVTARTLDDICHEEGIERIDLLKMNIEGAERPALLGMHKFLERTAVVAISCHDFKFDRTGNEFFRTKADVEAQLKALGFIVVPRESLRREIADQVNAYNPALFDIDNRQGIRGVTICL